MLRVFAILLVLTSSAWAIDAAKMGDGDYMAGVDDRLIITTTPFTAPRTLTLPYASGTNVPFSLVILDAGGAISITNNLTIVQQSGDLINGSSSPIVMSTAYGG